MAPLLFPAASPDFFAQAIHSVIIGLAIFAALVIGMIMAMRIAVLWYFKLDRIERHLSDILQELKKRTPAPPEPEPKP